MKRTATILFTLLILLQSFSKVWVVFSFKIHQATIAETLCINRDKPELLCSGKCVLNERLKADDGENGAQLPQKLKEQKEVVYCFENLSSWAAPVELPTGQLPLPQYFQYPPADAFVRGIFHPPNLLV